MKEENYTKAEKQTNKDHKPSRDDDTKNIETQNKTNKISKKKVVIVHGWEGDVSKGWFPWLKKELESKGFKVIMEQMPDSEAPDIEKWIPTLINLSGKIDDDTYFIGHSIGCQTIIRMLERLELDRVGGAIFLAGWFDLNEDTYKENPEKEEETRNIALPWIYTDIDFQKVQSKFPPGNITAIFSEDDPYVNISNAEMFKQKLGARILMEDGKKHFSESEIDMLPIILDELLRIVSKEQEEQDNAKSEFYL
ncbi:MAG: RBBP9/YdeN family alpha/beta hydrolase [Candidatus Woesearchaeota archaeon]